MGGQLGIAPAAFHLSTSIGLQGPPSLHGNDNNLEFRCENLRGFPRALNPDGFHLPTLLSAGCLM